MPDLKTFRHFIVLFCFILRYAMRASAFELPNFGG